MAIGLAERGTKRCPRCAHESSAAGRFCGQCGGPLAPQVARKQVTVLVADVSGFTAMSEHLDPEDVRGLMDMAFEVILDAVHRQHGRINQFLGDGVMALFEGPGAVAGEAHSRRALVAALAIQHGLGPIREEARRRYGIDFRLRIGMHTGAVVMGAIGEGLRSDYIAAGETTCVASRLANAADPGQIVISEAMKPSAEGLVTLAEAGAVTLDGRPDPVQALAVVGEFCEWVGDLRRPMAVGADVPLYA
jgi:class 3 adenylate cyclase